MAPLPFSFVRLSENLLVQDANGVPSSDKKIVILYDEKAPAVIPREYTHPIILDI